MNKMSLEALKQRADAVATDELLGQISGGTENACHSTSTGDDGGLTHEERVLFMQWLLNGKVGPPPISY